jgi:predicted ATPase
VEKIIIGGGQGSGKTSIIHELKKEFCCIEEASSYLIKSGFVPKEHSFLEFQNQVVLKQKEMEQKVNSKIVFLDRSLIDTILYLEEEGLTPTPELLNDITNANYSQVLFLEGLPEKYWNMPAHKKLRITTYAKGIERTKRLLEIYKRFGIKITTIPIAPIEKRIKMIKKIVD